MIKFKFNDKIWATKWWYRFTWPKTTNIKHLKSDNIFIEWMSFSLKIPDFYRLNFLQNQDNNIFAHRKQQKNKIICLFYSLPFKKLCYDSNHSILLSAWCLWMLLLQYKLMISSHYGHFSTLMCCTEYNRLLLLNMVSCVVSIVSWIWTVAQWLRTTGLFKCFEHISF